ncbi:MAG: HPr family phosphocarrier protein [Oscillospiraceae bacterium]|nr:HPr family phosphocarrier protein [Oscillospiraceae bacterium]
MKEFTYTITDPFGIHARPAGMLAKLCKGFESAVMIRKEDKEVDVKRLVALIGLAAKQGEAVTVTIDGPDEDVVLSALEAFFKENF